MKSLLILVSYHHRNTEKIAQAMAKVLKAQIVKPSEIDPSSLMEYDLVGFGSGVYSAQHDPSIIELAKRIPQVQNKRAFLFTTTGAPTIVMNDEFIKKNHSKLRTILESKGFVIAGEFGCRGWNTNSFLKAFGGLNRGHPDQEDLANAEKFALSLVG